MSIGASDRRSGVRTHRKGYYEAQGPLEPVRGANGHRECADDAAAPAAVPV